jgi:hypothetical protein
MSTTFVYYLHLKDSECRLRVQGFVAVFDSFGLGTPVLSYCRPIWLIVILLKC